MSATALKWPSAKLWSRANCPRNMLRRHGFVAAKHRLSDPKGLSLVTAKSGSHAFDDRIAAACNGEMMDVQDPSLTRASLLIQLRENTNTAAWQEFVKLYGPIIYGFARKRGLQDADAADLMQDVMRSVSSAISRLEYDQKQGTFRGWLFTITRNKIFNFLSARRIRPQASGDTSTNQMLNAHPEENDGAETWELEYQRRLAAMAMEQIRGEFEEKTWRAFEMTAAQGISASDVSKELGLSTGAIYVAKSRVLARLKKAVDALRLQEEN
jgi:RNA polymerase sigma factor (sigma-70 family)